MIDWISDQLDGLPLWGILAGMLVFFVAFYFGLTYFDIRADNWALPFGLNTVLTPLGITLLTFGGVIVGVVLGLVREQFA
jgi:hypothetical protein